MAASLSLSPADAGVPGKRRDRRGAIAAPDAHGERPPAVDAGAPPPTVTTPVAAPAVPHAPVEGQVLEKGTRRPVAGALVTVGQGAGTETAADGRFAADVPCGLLPIAVQAPGFEPLLADLDPCADPSPLVLRLTRKQGAPAYRTTVRAPTSLPGVNVQGPELVKTPGSLGDPFRAIESLPGVPSVRWPAPIYVVRGANPGNTGFFLDDLRVPALFHLALGPSVIHPYFFDSVDFYPGGYPARYGRYVAGIVAGADARGAVRRCRPRQRRRPTVRRRRAGERAASGRRRVGRGRRALLVHRRGALAASATPSGCSYWDYQLRADRNFGPLHLTPTGVGVERSAGLDGRRTPPRPSWRCAFIASACARGPRPPAAW